ncbi:MAG: chemotaxis protein CheW [Spirochaetales bacterium]|nr:chemotaxis protein CheW [Spirochaetales bacterium]
MKNAVHEPPEGEQTRVDYKMVTFTLAGKDYGIDIMKVKEISKASKFTFVPNAAPFVRGVYNLRGDIISVIDLRTFFNLSSEDEEGGTPVNMIILRLDDHVLAVIVDTIEKVVGISSEAVQPPHPLFGDINIKYISGVVEHEKKLYVVLDVERIFGTVEEEEVQEERPQVEAVQTSLPEQPSMEPILRENVDIGFIEETLVTFMNFHPSGVNQEWIHERFRSWKSQRGDDVQLSNTADAQAFLAPFTSPHSQTYWSAEYMDGIASLLPEEKTGNLHVWNPGCGSGHESYSIATVLKKRYPQVNLKIIAQDHDLIKISTAPGLTVDPGVSSGFFDPFLVDGDGSRQFGKTIKDSILFEYHDINHEITLPRLDMVVMRDTISYLPADRQRRVFSAIGESMKSGGIMILGSHEVPLDRDNWTRVEASGFVAYKKN